ncbi:hypothetical protein FRB91_000859 [Serendipita sp. 411]|nr:hypothetical protein FRB91_000859 [Serendipita sp. 411]
MSRGGKRTRSQSLEYRKPEIGIRTAGFGDDYIPFEFEDDNFRTGEDIPRKRKHEEVEEKVSEQKKFDRRPRLARYEDGTFTTPWMRNMKSSVPESAARFFHDEVEAFTRYISPTPAENELRRLIVKEIEIYARKIWSDATANAFGSVATGLYLPTGDIDVVIETVHVSSLSKASTQTALMRLANTLRNAGLAERRKIQVIAARVPIIKFNSVHGGIPIDISINQTNGIKAITMIKKYLDRFPALRSLILVVKAYLNQRGMNEVYKGGLGSYSIICLAISFLQVSLA